MSNPNPWAANRPAASLTAGLSRGTTTLLATAVAGVIAFGLLTWDEALSHLASHPLSPLIGVSVAGDATTLTLDAAARRAMDLAMQAAEPTTVGADLTPALLVPAGGVVRESLGQAHVWVALDTARFAQRQVTPVSYAESGARIAVTGALAPGEAVVAHGALFLDAAARR